MIVPVAVMMQPPPERMALHARGIPHFTSDDEKDDERGENIKGTEYE